MTQQNEERSFKCQQCGACCRWPGDVLLTDEDIRRLAEAVSCSEAVFIERYTVLASGRRQLSLAERPDGSCVLLDGDLCRVYEARPEHCRIFPHGWRVSEGCPALEELDKSKLNR